MALEEDALVDRIVVIEVNECESSDLAGRLVTNDVHLLYCSKFGEVFGEHCLSVVVLDSRDVESFR